MEGEIGKAKRGKKIGYRSQKRRGFRDDTGDQGRHHPCNFGEALELWGVAWNRRRKKRDVREE